MTYIRGGPLNPYDFHTFGHPKPLTVGRINDLYRAGVYQNADELRRNQLNMYCEEYRKSDLSQYLTPAEHEPTLDEVLDDLVADSQVFVTDVTVAHTMPDGDITEDGRELLRDFRDRMDKVLDAVDSILDESTEPYQESWLDDTPEDMTDRI